MSSQAAIALTKGDRQEGASQVGTDKVLSNVSRIGTVLRKTGETSSKRQAVALKTMGRGSAPKCGTACISVTQRSQLGSIIRIPRTQVYEERARILNQKFGLEIKPSRWQAADGEVLRVEKPVRVRIHRECHVCHASFGSSKECPKCKHQRCDQCPRDPLKRTKHSKEVNEPSPKKQAQAGPQPESTLSIYGSLEQIKNLLLTRPSRMGGADLVFKKPRMRIRRYCHVCTVQFTSNMRVCESCGHRRCPDCIRTPASKHHNEEAGEQSHSIYECHECHELYPQDAQEGTACSKCQHKKCPACLRTKPRFMASDPGPDPEELGGILNRIRDVNLEEA